MERTFEILLVEDNIMDLRLVREALRELHLKHHLQVAHDGAQALSMLRAAGPDTPRPDLVLLDLNIPGLKGREVLTAIKNDADLCRIPVIILSGSVERRDVLECYQLNANSYVVKPQFFSDYISLMRAICDYWLAKVELPVRPAAA